MRGLERIGVVVGYGMVRIYEDGEIKGSIEIDDMMEAYLVWLNEIVEKWEDSMV